MDEDGKLSKRTLKFISGEFDVQSIHTISLTKLGLNDISALAECSGLERLDLSYNDITRLHALSTLTSLASLDLSANSVTTLEGLQSLENLEKLNLSGNLIGSCDSLRCLSKIEKLHTLKLKDTVDAGLSNPICMNVSYKRSVLTLLPQLKILDEWLVGAGGQLFRLFDEIDTALEDARATPRDGPIKMAVMPPTLNLEDASRRTGPADFASVYEAEKHFKETLVQCDILKVNSETLLRDLHAKLHEKEKA